MKPVYSAYTPPVSKKKKHVQRAHFNTRGKAAGVVPVAETTSAPQATAPSLAEVPQGNATPTPQQQVAAKSVTMKPGKKEKIRFGQAPRETLPAAPTKQKMPARTPHRQTVATNNAVETAQVYVGPEEQSKSTRTKSKKPVTRLALRSRSENKGPKVDPFAPPPITTEEVATQKQQSQALGLNGDTSKVKKKNPHKEGPKRRMTDEKKDQTQPASTSPAAPASSPATTPAAPVRILLLPQRQLRRRTSKLAA